MDKHELELRDRLLILQKTSSHLNLIDNIFFSRGAVYFVLFF